MKRKLLSLLREADLRDEEIRVYFLLLTLRQAGVPELIAKSGLPSMTVYRTVQRLHERGLVDEMPLNNKQKLYKPLSLSVFAQTIAKENRRLKKLELSLRNLDPLLPFFSVDSKEEDSEGVELREGLDAFREEYLRFPDLCKNEYLHIGNMLNYWDTAQMTYECPEERAFINKRISRGIQCRIVDLHSEKFDEISNNNTRELRKIKYSDDIPLHKNYLGFAENHASYFICEPENPRVLVIKQPELLELYKFQFETLWKQSN